MDYKMVYGQMQAGEDEKALRNLAKSLMPSCIAIIRSNSIYKEVSEAANVYYHAYLYVKSRIEENTFQYMGDKSFQSYFKTACRIMYKEFMRLDESPNTLPFPEESIIFTEDAEEQFQEIMQHEYQRKFELYGVDLSKTEAPKFLMTSLVKIFHTLSEKCKFLIILRYFLNLTHFQIVESLYLFYEIKNEDVSKAELSRCLSRMRERLGNKENYLVM